MKLRPPLVLTHGGKALMEEEFQRLVVCMNFELAAKLILIPFCCKDNKKFPVISGTQK